VAKPTVVLFDIDGTLISCGGAGRRSIRAALEGSGIDVAHSDFEFGGMTDRAIARRVMETAGREVRPEDVDQLLELYLERLEDEVAASPGYRVLPGVQQVLDSLHERHLAVGLGTGNVERGARIKLRRAALDTRFEFGGFGCDDEDRAALLETGARRGAARLGVDRAHVRIVVVGDTPKDVLAAHAIGAECIAVATGSFDVTALHACSPKRVLADLSEGLPLS
jgi:phosphoglycolate phosphatase